jgi:tetratricopeptide (TPR) repeat protein
VGSLSWKLEVSHNELESLPGWIGSLVELQAEGNRFQSLPMSMEFAKEGAAHLSKGHYEKAINAYNCALLLNPWDAVALHNRGDAKFALARGSPKRG